MSDLKDYGPMWVVSGPSLGLKWRKFRSRERAKRCAAKLGDGHTVTEGIGGRRGWRSTEVTP